MVGRQKKMGLHPPSAKHQVRDDATSIRGKLMVTERAQRRSQLEGRGKHDRHASGLLVLAFALPLSFKV